MLYLDNSATTYVLPEVRKKMIHYLSDDYGNPSSKYYSLAQNAKKAIDQARIEVASLLNTKEKEIIFTSGATESNNFIIKGVADYYKEKGNHIITTKAEHSSVKEVCKYLETNGFDITYLDVDSHGRIDIKQLDSAITSETILVSIIWGNNELGSLNSMEEISEVCKKQKVFLHTDATQIVGKHKIDLTRLNGISFLSCSAHKMHGPKGVGAAFIRMDEYNQLLSLTPLLHGGEQEPYRSGTYAVHNIVGFGEACRIARENQNENIKKLEQLEQKFISILKEKFSENISINSDVTNKVPGIVNVRFKGVKNQILLHKLAPIVAASTGSACSTTKPSHVLKAAGFDDKEIEESIRFSMSPYTEIEDLELFYNL